MTRSEREELGKVVRLRARVTKASLDTLAADRRAQVEAELSAIHRADAEQWKEITAAAEKAVREAGRLIADICDQRGIRPAFRPALTLNWYGRGENASASRRAELRKLADTRIEADRKAGYQLVEAWAADKLTALVSGALTTAEARGFLELLPTPESLLPPVRVAELDAAFRSPRELVEADR